jgi:CrcB protein
MDWIFGFVLIGLAGGAGSVLRALLSKLDGWLPYGLFLANSLAAGLVAWLLLRPDLSLDLVTIASIGFAGGLSTFSTAMKACFDFYHRGRLFQALITMAGNLFIPMLAVMLAASLG